MIHPFSCRRRVAVMAFAMQFACVVARAAVTVPDETFSSPKQLQAVLLDIQQQSYDSAADRMQTLLEKHGSELSKTDDDGLISVDYVFATIPEAGRAAMQGAYETKFGGDANQLLSAVRGKSGYRPQDLYAMAKRYPLARAAGTALAYAGDRAADQGDFASARVFYSMAIRHGWHGDAAAQARAASIAAPSLEAVNGAFGAAGPLPFDAPWFNLPTGFEADKLFPVGSGDVAVVAGEHAVLGIGPDGVVAWRWKTPDRPQAPGQHFQPGTTGRGRLSVAAILASDSGQAKAVIVCQPVPNDTRGCLTALRASDGRLLWSTQSDAKLGLIAFLGSPAVAGRFVIAVGLETASADASSATLQLVAVDATDGHLLWRTQLAAIGTTQGARGLELYRDQSPPMIVDDCVYVSPNVGAVFSIDRFDGEIRWIRPYRQAVIGDGAVRKYVDQRSRGRDLIAPLAWTDLLRWNCTPHIAANIVLTAPQDTPAVISLEATTGKLLWESGNLPQATPVGVAADKLILSGAKITAIDPANGQKAWTFAPVTGVRLTGPAVIRGREILTESTAGLLSISPIDGSSKPSESTIDFHPASASEAGKAALAGGQISNAFGLPAEKR